ncbi:collagen alpha-1(XVI) chain-like isoform X1 [Accipiter gentilis]|uniref:collagen alpha-1(XVI) chain-like isoform X1 n=1 Tax=Astur gentilis TaxID=8957 RepID=UPI0021104F87|nr:collagen alpha-1(XVI) chain-like isoform X1 [Accipiter gentilis]
MATAGPDLYESLQIRYPPSPARTRALGSPLAASRWTLGTTLAVGTGVVLVLGAALAVLITLYVQGQAELWAARAELAAVRAPLLPDPNGPRSPRESPAAVQRRKEQLGNVPGLGGDHVWDTHPWATLAPAAVTPSPRLPNPQGGGCRDCPWAGGTTRGRSTTSRGSGSPGATRRPPAAPRTPTSPLSPALRSRTTWRRRRGENLTGSDWQPQAPGAPGTGWMGLPIPRPRVSGHRGSRTAPIMGAGAGRTVPRSTPWAMASGTTITATSASPGSARGT